MKPDLKNKFRQTETDSFSVFDDILDFKEFLNSDEISVVGKARIRVPTGLQLPIPTPSISIDAHEISFEGETYYSFTNLYSSSLETYLVKKKDIYVDLVAQTLPNERTTDPFGSLNLLNETAPALFDRVVEHNTAKIMLSTEESLRGEVNTYCVSVSQEVEKIGFNPAPQGYISRSPMVVHNNAPYFLVMNEMDNYCRSELLPLSKISDVILESRGKMTLPKELTDEQRMALKNETDTARSNKAKVEAELERQKSITSFVENINFLSQYFVKFGAGIDSKATLDKMHDESRYQIERLSKRMKVIVDTYGDSGLLTSVGSLTNDSKNNEVVMLAALDHVSKAEFLKKNGFILDVIKEDGKKEVVFGVTDLNKNLLATIKADLVVVGTDSIGKEGDVIDDIEVFGFADDSIKVRAYGDYKADAVVELLTSVAFIDNSYLEFQGLVNEGSGYEGLNDYPEVYMKGSVSSKGFRSILSGSCKYHCSKIADEVKLLQIESKVAYPQDSSVVLGS